MVIQLPTHLPSDQYEELPDGPWPGLSQRAEKSLNHRPEQIPGGLAKGRASQARVARQQRVS
jgi:hypothetical protein